MKEEIIRNMMTSIIGAAAAASKSMVAAVGSQVGGTSMLASTDHQERCCSKGSIINDLASTSTVTVRKVRVAPSQRRSSRQEVLKRLVLVVIFTLQLLVGRVFAADCTHREGGTSNNQACRCIYPGVATQSTECTQTTGFFCQASEFKKSECSMGDFCPNTEGNHPNEEDCACGRISFSSSTSVSCNPVTGRYCKSEGSPTGGEYTCTHGPQCSFLNAEKKNELDCACGSKSCNSFNGLYCIASINFCGRACPEQQYRDTNTGACLRCPAGKGFDGLKLTQASQCVTCSRGYFSTSRESSSACERCSAGKYSDEKALREDSQCKPCSAGKWSAGTGLTSDKACIACGAGKFADTLEDGQTKDVCRGSCSRGKYSDETALTADSQCKLCSAGKWSNGTGLSSEADCISCLPGKYSSSGSGQERENVCDDCPSGKYGEGETGKDKTKGPTSCDDCPGGYSQKASGRQSCTTCFLGYFSEGASDYCDLCTYGKYQDENIQNSCKSCPNGTFGFKLGASSEENGCVSFIVSFSSLLVF